MPSGIYLRTEKHSFNKGKKHPNRKRYAPGLTPINKVCPFCKDYFVTNCLQPKKKFCSQSCSSKNNRDINIANLEKRDKEKQRAVVSARVGEKHHAWIKDRTLLKDDHLDRGGQRHRDWSNTVKIRDGWKCKIGNQDCEGRMESHHILSWKNYEELRYDVNNGITLCHYHHPRTRVNEIEFEDYFQKLLTSL